MAMWVPCDACGVDPAPATGKSPCAWTRPSRVAHPEHTQVWAAAQAMLRRSAGLRLHAQGACVPRRESEV